MFLSVFDMFKVGIGPSSSHTIGPMVAAARFLDHLRALPFGVAGIKASLHGSLAFTGVGHATDRAVILGLSGFRADDYDAAKAEAEIARIQAEHTVLPTGLGPLHFHPNEDVLFDYGPALAGHANGLSLKGVDAQGDVITQVTYYSIGGGFVLTEAELAAGKDTQDGPPVPYPFKSAAEMLVMANASGKSVAQMKRANELSRKSGADVDKGLTRIWEVMNAYMSTYAMAVNEENAAGGQVVTAPTNGAAGVVPATLRYYLDHVPGAAVSKVPEFLLTAAAIGGLIKFNASISGAECGCQAEVGSAAAMAAGGLCAVLGGTAEQVENAAEIALEHHLGMTCDPVRGLVQVPCIERNGLGAIKAVSAASLSMRGDGTHLVPLDAAIETMRQTGEDMSEKYKETSLGGLAVNIPNC